MVHGHVPVRGPKRCPYCNIIKLHDWHCPDEHSKPAVKCYWIRCQCGAIGDYKGEHWIPPDEPKIPVAL